MSDDDVPTDVPQDPRERLEFLTAFLRAADWGSLPSESQASISKAHDKLAEAIAHILVSDEVAEKEPASETATRDVWIDESIDDERVEAALDDLGISPRDDE